MMEKDTKILDFLLEKRQNVFFLSDVNPEKLVKYACALANTRGGTLLIGVNNKGEIVGIDDDSFQKINQCLNTQVSPLLPYLVNVVENNNRKIAIVSIWEGTNKPYVTEEAFFIQMGDAIMPATPDEVIKLFENQQEMNQGWERKIQESAKLDDIDRETLEKVTDALVRKNVKFAKATKEEIMQAMGFVKDSLMTNAGVVVMYKQPSVLIPQTRIRVSVFAEDHGKPALVDVRLYEVSLVKAVDEIANYIYNLYPGGVVIDGMMRLNMESMPLVAIREGLLNAVVHRQYNSYQSFVAVNIYADYLEIVNSGTLLNGVTLESLKSTHRSVLRNPDIANAFYQLGYIEMAGSGTLRILEECRRNRCEEPIWSVENGCVVLTFPNVRHNRNRANENRTMDLTLLTTDASVRESLKVIIEYMDKHDHVKLHELTDVTGKSYPSVKRYMQILKDAGVVEYKGNLRSGGWSKRI